MTSKIIKDETDEEISNKELKIFTTGIQIYSNF